jgi:nitroreductase
VDIGEEVAMTAHLTEAWTLAEADFPATGPPAARWRFLLRYAVLAPSGHNTQPWRFRIAGDRLELYADRTRALPVVDPEDRALTISCGAALGHLRAAIRHFGYAGDVHAFPDPADADLLASVGLGRPAAADPEEDELFCAIPRRHTNRTAFAPRPVPEVVLADLQEVAAREAVSLHVVRDAGVRHRLAQLVVEGDRVQFGDRRFRRELAAWMHSNRALRRDGMPGYAQGLGDLPSLVSPLVVRIFDVGGGQAARDRQLAEGSPVLAVFGTAGDTPPAWLATGQALSAVLLRATARGLAASFLNQPIEVPALRPRLRALLGTDDLPQLLVRLGYGSAVQPTPRRPVDEVLVPGR